MSTNVFSPTARDRGRVSRWKGAKPSATAERSVVPAQPAVVGGTVSAVCPACKTALAHTIVRKVAAAPTRVECSQCHDVHAYRSPIALARAKTRRVEVVSASAPPDWNERWRRALSRSGTQVTPYSSDRRFAVGQRLGHASFGDGVVVQLASPTVCTVLFQDGEHKLLMARRAEEASRKAPA